MRVTTGYIGVMGRATFQAKAVSWPIGRKKLCERRFIRCSMHGITFSSGGGEPGPAWIAQPNHPQIQEEKEGLDHGVGHLGSMTAPDPQRLAPRRLETRKLPHHL
jgi:hypothetical protein